MRKAELQEKYNEMARSGNWNFETCQVLCAEADLMDAWQTATPETFENVVSDAVGRLGLQDVAYKTRDLHVNLSNAELRKLSVLDDLKDLDDIAERLLVLLANGRIPSAYLWCDDPYSFEGWLVANEKMGQALELVQKPDEGSRKGLDYLYDVYSDTVGAMVEKYDNAIEGLKNIIK